MCVHMYRYEYNGNARIVQCTVSAKAVLILLPFICVPITCLSGTIRVGDSWNTEPDTCDEENLV